MLKATVAIENVLVIDVVTAHQERSSGTPVAESLELAEWSEDG